MMSKLNNELANSIATVSEGGLQMIHHKYFVGIWSDNDFVIDHANNVYNHKKEAIDEAIKEKNINSYLWLHERAYRVESIINALNDWWKPSKKEYWELISFLWTDTENVYENKDYWEQLLFLEFSDSHLMMNEEDTKFFNELPSTITIYRGGVDDKGYSWTLDKEKAEWFANRFNFDYEVFEKTINKSDVFAYLNDRNESEIIYRKDD
tara:strand:- start:2067 stop:2690 length:624 start_codon:yes stop_codon:yes gene_type:complete